jgi:hypothetical protein
MFGVMIRYAIAHYADFHTIHHLRVLGNVMSGAGGQHILDRAAEGLRAEFPEHAARIRLHLPDEQDKRHGQAIAAASLPKLARS